MQVFFICVYPCSSVVKKAAKKENMSNSQLMNEIAAKQVNEGEVAAWWLGGSGFVFKNAEGKTACIDPYLSDSVKAMHNQGRAFPAPIAPEDLRVDVIISTHWHEDHLDPGTIPLVAKHSPHTQFVMPPSSMSRAISWGVERSRITTLLELETVEIAGIEIEATPARHDAGIPGWAAPDAIGIVLHIGGKTIYHCGDSEYDVRLRLLKKRAFDVGIFCINGATGNMDAHEAALLAWQLRAKTVLPMHHILWDVDPSNGEATLDPNLFANTYKNLGGTARVILPEIGAEMQL